MANILERLILYRIQDILPVKNLIPDHQFGFRQNHSTIQKCHRIVNKIKESLEGNKMCASPFVKVWYEELLFKLKMHLPDLLYLILESYISDRNFQVKIDDTI